MNLPISQLPSITGSTLGYISPESEFAVAQDGVTYKVKQSQLSPLKYVYGLYSQTSNSTPVSGTTTESTLIGGGIGTLSVPQNGFTVGDSFSANLGGIINSANNDTIRVRVKSGSVIFLDSDVESTVNLTDTVWEMFINFTIRSIGAAGVASISSYGTFHVTKKNSSSIDGFSFNGLNNTTFDTTILNTLDVTVQWGSNNVSNNIYTEFFVLNKVF